MSVLQPVLQNWLLFGTIHTLFGSLVELSDFQAVTSDGTGRLCTAALMKAIEGWIDRSVDPKASNDVQSAMMKQSCDGVYRNLEISYHAACGARELADPGTLIAVSMLGDTMTSIMSTVYQGVLKLETPIAMPWKRAFAHLLVPHFKERGWCPNIVSRLISDSTRNFMALYFCLNLWRSESQHRHDSCTIDLYAATTIDPDTYKVSHVDPKCSCPMFGINATDISQTLRQGSLPLLGVPTNEDLASVHPKLQKKSHNVPFVAISHVWADGIGNTQDNSLPTCSLGRISRLVNALPRLEGDGDTISFWIDSVCVPVSPPEVKQLALTYLREPYKHARHVLVLDRGLLSIPCEGLNLIDVLANLMCSNWVGRLWTLQEGQLGQRVWFQFQDKAVALESLREAWLTAPKTPQAPFYRDMFAAFGAAWHSTKALKDFQIDVQISPISRLRMMLASRSVSVPSDEALCLFALAGLDLSVAAAIPGNVELRMKTFWNCIGDVPVGILFSKYPKKLETLGYRWAPSSFMGSLEHARDWDGGGFISNDLKGSPSANGLICHRSGFILELDVSKIPVYKYSTGFFFKHESGWYRASEGETWHRITYEPQSGMQKIVLLLMKPIWEEFAAQSTEPTEWDIFTPAILAFIAKEADDADIIQVKCWRHFSVKIDPVEQAINNAAWDAVGDCTDKAALIAGGAASLAARLLKNNPDLINQCDQWAAGTSYASGVDRLAARIVELATPTDDFAGEAELVMDQCWCVD